MTVVEEPQRWPVPDEFSVICDACGFTVTPDEEPPHLDRDSALDAADLRHDALVREDEQVRCYGCVDDARIKDDACDGGGEVTWNPSRIGDPQCEQSGPCGGCINCRFMEGDVDAKGDEMPAEPVTTSGTKGGPA